MLLSKLKNHQVATNASWIIVCKLCKAILALISTMIVSRYLGVEKYGILNYAASIVAFVTPIMKLGINEILVHELISAPDKEGQTLGTTVALNLCSGALCAVAVWAFSYIANDSEKETIIVCCCYSLQLFFQAIEMVFYWFQAKLKAKYTSIAILSAYIVVVLIQIILVLLKSNIYLFAISNTMEYLFIAVILLTLYRKEKSQRFSFSLSTARRLITKSKYYIISGLMVTVFSQTDKIMLKLMCDGTAVGNYSAAVTCASMTSFVFVAIIDSFRPIIFSKQHDKGSFEVGLKSLYSIIIWFSLLQCIAITIFAPIIIRLLYGSDFLNAIVLLKIIVWFTTFSYLGTIRNIWILAYGLQRYLGWINMFGALMNIMLNLLLIPAYGPSGAAFASVVSQIFTNVGVGYVLPPLREHNRLMVDGANPKYIIGMLNNINER